MHALRLVVDNEDGSRLHASFGLQGGTIGRADHNTLVLSDDARSVSRLHARVEWRAGRFLLVNMGINPVLCDGTLVSTADEVELRDGQTLRIGGFVLDVQRIDAQDDPALALAEDEVLFDDMTGQPLPRHGGAAPTVPVDVSVFDMRSVTAPAPPDLLISGPVPWMPPASAAASPWLPELLAGLGCDAQGLPAIATPHALGVAVRQALDEALRAAGDGADIEACRAVFEQVVRRACHSRGERQT